VAPPPRCRICDAEPTPAGVVHGSYSGRDYHLSRCARCGFAFIADPWLDFAAIYDDRYYAGEGADPLVDYGFELDHPQRTIRRYEWRGIAAVVDGLCGPPDGERRWLDYGCGHGGLVRHLRALGAADAYGFDEGSIAAQSRARAIPMLRAGELPALAGSFDVVTAIEVLEHTLDPVAELRRMRALLRPGGLLFLTTGNARPYADRLTKWRYVVPEIHIAFFEPRTLDLALTRAGFAPEHPELGRGFDEILKFKALKNLHVRRRSAITDALPSRAIGAIVDRIARFSEHPVGRAA
jgi:SAM-dependent methyltransferase